jgi:thioredoxin reductase (NADPH)
VAKPSILAVDDDPQVLAAVARDLRRQYGEEYRIIRSTSGTEAVDVLTQLKGRGETVAAFVVDQRMPVMTGVEFLVQARELYPDAKRILLTAYADTEAAIVAINDVDLDHYLMKPWDPPEANLYPVMDDLLDDWRANAPAPYQGIRVVGTRWSPASHDLRDFLARNRIPYRFADVEQDSDARTTVEAAGHLQSLPVVLFPDGSLLVQPDHRVLAQRAGLQTEARNPFYDLVIVGGGPAGLGAAVYGASEGLNTALIERAATGGQAGTSARIENYLGFPHGVTGSDLARRAVTQALRFGAEILTAVEVAGVRTEDPARFVTLSDGTELGCRALLVASGMTIRRLPAEGHERLVGSGVYYGAAPSEAATYTGEDVLVVGGANSAGQAAVMLSKYAKSVTILARAPSLDLSMSRYLIDQIEAIDNISVRVDSRVVGVEGDERLESITVRRVSSEEEERMSASGLFIFIGARPHTEFLEGVVERDSRGFVLTGPDLRVDGRWPASWPLSRDPYLLETSVPGIFAAGDVRAGVVRRVASAVGQGAVAISFVHQYLATV